MSNKSPKTQATEDIFGEVGVAIASYNQDIVFNLFEGFIKELARASNNGLVPIPVHVPGALEISHGLRLLASQHPKIKALVAIGCVIKGDTYHFKIVSNISAAAVQKVNEDTGIPVLNGISTCYTEEQAKQRANSNGLHLAQATVNMVKLGCVSK